MATREVTGTEIRDALSRWNETKDILAARFERSLFRFETDPVGAKCPEDLATELEAAERAAVLLGAMQDAYNVSVRLPDGSALAVGIKLVGALGRMRLAWKKALRGPKEARYERPSRSVRDRDALPAQPAFDVDKAQVALRALTRKIQELQRQIGRANETKVTMEVREGLLD